MAGRDRDQTVGHRGGHWGRARARRRPSVAIRAHVRRWRRSACERTRERRRPMSTCGGVEQGRPWPTPTPPAASSSMLMNRRPAGSRGSTPAGFERDIAHDFFGLFHDPLRPSAVGELRHGGGRSGRQERLVEKHSQQTTPRHHADHDTPRHRTPGTGTFRAERPSIPIPFARTTDRSPCRASRGR